MIFIHEAAARSGCDRRNSHRYGLLGNRSPARLESGEGESSVPARGLWSPGWRPSQSTLSQAGRLTELQDDAFCCGFDLDDFHVAGCWAC
jgi:hypothetical protein